MTQVYKYLNDVLYTDLVLTAAVSSYVNVIAKYHIKSINRHGSFGQLAKPCCKDFRFQDV